MWHAENPPPKTKEFFPRKKIQNSKSLLGTMPEENAATAIALF